MTASSSRRDPDVVRRELVEFLDGFDRELRGGQLRARVLALVPATKVLMELGTSLVPAEAGDAARDRILYYLRAYPRVAIGREELMIVAGIQEWARRVRELRVEAGWSIVTGATVKEMQEEGDFELPGVDAEALSPYDYILLQDEPDIKAAERWNLGHEIRKKQLSVRDKILEFLRANVGQEIAGEELRYVAKDKTEWARRTRELRTEFGWPIVTRNTGRPDLAVGVYVLEADRRSPKHDRSIPDRLRRAVLRRDHYMCQECGWTHDLWNRSDPRHLELHHRRPHARGGETVESNLATLCTACHDEVHRRDS